MIRVHKPAVPPPILADRGRRETDANLTTYLESRAAYDAGTATFSFESSIYGDRSVKEALKSAQHDKCCFCESKISHISYGDVEHFRPKAGYWQDEGLPLGRPGYYWLAYEWGNLYLCCQLCNQRHKKNHFPLADETRRCRNHLGSLADEEPLFIDPGAEDPEEHIEYLAEQPRGRNGSRRGEETIEALGLRREPLREKRFDRYRLLKALRDVSLLLPNEREGQEAAAILEDAVRDEAEYASMVRCLVRF